MNDNSDVDLESQPDDIDAEINALRLTCFAQIISARPITVRLIEIVLTQSLQPASDCTNIDARGNLAHSKFAKSETSRPSLTTKIQRSAPCGAVARDTRVTVSATGERRAWQPRLGRAAKSASRKFVATQRDSVS